MASTESYVVCGVDVYRTPEIAADDGVEIDTSKKFRLHGLPDMFFSGRHYRIIHHNSNFYDAQTSIPDLREALIELQPDRVSVLVRRVLEQNDTDTAYVLTPLSDSELDEL